MRVVKEAEERKNEILDVAQELFVQKGFDYTSTNDILERIGIARGTLYYHFKSKEDILDSLIKRITREAMASATRISNDKSISLFERFTLTIKALNIDNSIGQEVMQQVHKPQNALMHQKMREELLSGIVPIITKLVSEGIEEDIFHVEYPKEAVEMIMLYSNIAFDGLISEEVKERKIKGFIVNVERLLGCEPEMMQEPILKIFQ